MHRVEELGHHQHPAVPADLGELDARGGEADGTDAAGYFASCGLRALETAPQQGVSVELRVHPCLGGEIGRRKGLKQIEHPDRKRPA
jgi:hypothetical protein